MKNSKDSERNFEDVGGLAVGIFEIFVSFGGWRVNFRIVPSGLIYKPSFLSKPIGLPNNSSTL